MKTTNFAVATAVAALTLSAGCTPPPTNWYIDNDMDGYGDPTIVISGGDQPSGYVANRRDCNDSDDTINPAATEVLDGIDNDCDSEIDNVPFWYADTDTDGYGDPTVSLQEPLQPEGYVSDNTDCDDTNGTINPAAVEIVGDSIDNNCNGTVDEILYAIGDTGPAGGTVFYVDGTGQHGLESAPEDPGGYAGAEWGCSGIDIPGADGTAVGTGTQNTADILTGCTEAGIAAELANNYTLNGFDDWFLPSKDELNLVYSEGLILGGYPNPECYWSSSEDGLMNDGSAWAIWNMSVPGYVNPGDEANMARASDCGVRPIRAL